MALSPSGAVVPALAKSWKRPDARTYVYNLRSDARFTDGTPMQIEDVLYSLQMAMSAKASPTLASYYAGGHRQADRGQSGHDQAGRRLGVLPVRAQCRRGAVGCAKDVLGEEPQQHRDGVGAAGRHRPVQGDELPAGLTRLPQGQ